MATGRASPRFVGMIHKVSDLRYFRNVTVGNDLRYGRTKEDWCVLFEREAREFQSFHVFMFQLQVRRFGVVLRVTDGKSSTSIVLL